MAKLSPDKKTPVPEQPFYVIGIAANEPGGVISFVQAIPGWRRMAFLLFQPSTGAEPAIRRQGLQKTTDVPVELLTNAAQPAPGQLYLIPPNQAITVRDGSLRLKRPGKDQQQELPTADTFFTTLAKLYGSLAVGVLLAPAGTSGLKGLRAIEDNGGVCFVQETGTRKVDRSVSLKAARRVTKDSSSPEGIAGKLVEALKNHSPNNKTSVRQGTVQNSGSRRKMPAAIPAFDASPKPIPAKTGGNPNQPASLGLYAETLVNAIDQPLIIVDRQLRVQAANPAFRNTLMPGVYQYRGASFIMLFGKRWDLKDLPSQLAAVGSSRSSIENYELIKKHTGNGKRILRLDAVPLRVPGGVEELILVAVKDIANGQEQANTLIRDQELSPGNRMLALVNDILDISTIDAGKMSFANVPFNFRETVSSVTDLFKIQLQEKNTGLATKYDPQIPAVISGDPVRLHQVILNLMSNAVKFTTGGEIIIEVSMLAETVKRVKLQVAITDTGPAIRKEQLGLIFDNFQQVHIAGSGFISGTGLGLSMLKNIIEVQGGQVSVKTTAQEGLVFTFTLDFNKVIRQVPPTTAIPEDTAYVFTGKRALVVEDTALNPVLMKALLQERGLEADIVNGGKEAILKLKRTLTAGQKVYDLVMIDLQMPDMDGFEAADLIRKSLKLDTPILAITADISPQAIAQIREAGMNDFISKPVDEQQLVTKVAELIRVNVEAVSTSDEMATRDVAKEKNRVTDLTYLRNRTGSDRALEKEMIEVYLKQTPVLLARVKEGVLKKDWFALKAAMHKMHVSFSIMGFDGEFQRMSSKLQDYTGDPDQLQAMLDMIRKIESACRGAISELKQELESIVI